MRHLPVAKGLVSSHNGDHPAKKPSSSAPVRAWEESVTIPTYPAPPADRNPMFLDKRVYQGSSGKVYPNPFTDHVSDDKIDKSYQAVFLENEFIRIMILPEIGGRIHIGQDKTNNYDFFYRQSVIKPALVGLLGPWISGGVEFNWPQHHRPSTFMPVDYKIEQHEDGSRTVWLSEHEPINRMKGMVGISLHPGKSIVEAKARLYNRTALVQTYLWWANVGVRVHDQYQAFFPPDVDYVADHAKRAISSFPIARTSYYGVDYTKGVDITWYKNIPVPTSYMVLDSNHDFFGGYDHGRKAGLVHVADRHVSPGKKLWTWGNAEFGSAWDRELTDSDGPYVELMAGVFTDNQPDFSWLQPYETRTFSQYWYPIQEIGPAKNANLSAAVNLQREESGTTFGVCVTEAVKDARIILTAGEKIVFDQSRDIYPGGPVLGTVDVSSDLPESHLLIRVLSPDGKELIRYRPEEKRQVSLPEAATEPPAPAQIATSEELYLTGLHLEQYRHATCSPESYWEEGLRRDPNDARCNNALGLLHLRRGEFQRAEKHFRRAIERLTKRNPNPRDGEPYYNLGLALNYQGLRVEAHEAFYKSVWNQSWRSPGYYSLATIASHRGQFERALEFLQQSLSADGSHLKARNLRAALLRRLGRTQEALDVVQRTLIQDGLDFGAVHEFSALSQADPTRSAHPAYSSMYLETQTCLDVAFDYIEAGLWPEAIGLLEQHLAALPNDKEPYPMVLYSLGYFCEANAENGRASEYFQRAVNVSPDYCFPARLEEMLVLQRAIKANSEDAKAHYYLGNLLYDKCRREEAIEHWERSCQIDPRFAIPWRNLGIAWHNVRGNPERAMDCYEQAFRANPSDARVFYELDQLRKRTGVSASQRLSHLERHRNLVGQRDDLVVELVTLYNQTGHSAEALQLLGSRRFHPWEGGEGLVSGQYVAAHLLLGRQLLRSGNTREALTHFDAARNYPRNMGEAKHLVTLETHLDYFSGLALRDLGLTEEARSSWEKAARSQTGKTEMTFYRALALRQLKDEPEAVSLLSGLLEYASHQINATVKIDYFATSLPNFLLFDDDLQRRNRIHCLFLAGLAKLGLGRKEEAAADFREVLDLDINHMLAQTELESIELVPVAGPKI
jgi:tetratricopeptide (TPR) repeat protein